MSDIGPELPPHLLAKRKRKQEDDAKTDALANPGAKRSPSPKDGDKRRRLVGPAMPPAPLEERPIEPAQHQNVLEKDEGDGDDEDDDFGPALPPSRADEDDTDTATARSSAIDEQTEATLPAERLRRDEWMMMPPKQDDLAARMDPTKQRARGFNTGKGAAAASHASSDDNSAWHETPEQKQKRLADEVMGVSKPSATGPRKAHSAGSELASQKIKGHAEKTRGPSLLDQHAQSKGKDAEDDPSARAFDKEKDMGSGMRIGHSQRKEMLGKAAAYSSRFSGGSYL